MTFEQRRAKAREMLTDFLGVYTPPRGISDDGLANLINFISDAFARRMPTTGDYAEKIEGVFAKVRDTHQSNTWPTQAVFVSHMPNQERAMKGAQTTFKPDDVDEAYAKRMDEGGSVPESVIWGAASGRLLNAGRIDRNTLDAYRKKSVWSHQDTYGPNGIEKLRERYGDRVEGFV